MEVTGRIISECFFLYFVITLMVFVARQKKLFFLQHMFIVHQLEISCEALQRVLLTAYAGGHQLIVFDVPPDTDDESSPSTSRHSSWHDAVEDQFMWTGPTPVFDFDYFEQTPPKAPPPESRPRWPSLEALLQSYLPGQLISGTRLLTVLLPAIHFVPGNLYSCLADDPDLQLGLARLDWHETGRPVHAVMGQAMARREDGIIRLTWSQTQAQFAPVTDLKNVMVRLRWHDVATAYQPWSALKSDAQWHQDVLILGEVMIPADSPWSSLWLWE